MALIDTIDELKRHNSSVTLQLSVESIQSFIDDAVNKHLIPGISRAQYDALLADKDTMVADSVQETLFLLVQKAAVNFAVGYYTSYGTVQLSDSGAHVVQSGDLRIASDKKTMQLRRQSLADGYYALELAIEYLEANLVSFPLYTASSAHSLNRNGFINSSAEFNTVSAIQIDPQIFASIKNVQRQIQDDQITAILGETLAETLLAAVKAGTPTADQTALIARIRKALVPLTLCEAIPYKLITVDVNGVFQLSDTVGGISGNVENRTPAEESRTQMAMMRLESKGEAELESLRKWLNANAATFTDYTEQTTRTDSDPNVSGAGIYMI